MPTNTYSKKSLSVIITLRKGGANNQYVFENCAIRTTIEKTGGAEFAKATVDIYGLTIETMAKLTTLSFQPLRNDWNFIEILAGEQGTTLQSVFKGEITLAYADLNGGKVLKIQAQTGAYPVLMPDPPRSVVGEQSASSLIESLAKQANYSFSNEGVTAMVKDMTVSGDPVTKMRTIATQVGAELLIDDDEVVLLPSGGSRKALGGVPVVSVDSGMIGYPTFTNTGLNVSTYFRPDLRLAALVHVESIIPGATGDWRIVKLSHELSVNNPSGSAWRTNFETIFNF